MFIYVSIAYICNVKSPLFSLFIGKKCIYLHSTNFMKNKLINKKTLSL